MVADRNGIRDLPGSPVVKIPLSNGGSVGWIPGRGTKIPHAAWLGCNFFFLIKLSNRGKKSEKNTAETNIRLKSS